MEKEEQRTRESIEADLANHTAITCCPTWTLEELGSILWTKAHLALAACSTFILRNMGWVTIENVIL